MAIRWCVVIAAARSPPPAQPPRQKLATEMTDDEYRAARAAILKRQLLRRNYLNGHSEFPAALQPIIQQGFLEREFQQALSSRLGYRACADREEIAVGIGETLTKTRAGLKPSVTTPLRRRPTPISITA